MEHFKLLLVLLVLLFIASIVVITHFGKIIFLPGKRGVAKSIYFFAPVANNVLGEKNKITPGEMSESLWRPQSIPINW